MAKVSHTNGSRVSPLTLLAPFGNDLKGSKICVFLSKKISTKKERFTLENLHETARKARNDYMKQYRQSMTQEQKDKEREYHRQWRSANRDRMKEHQANYWIRKAEKMQEAVK